MIVLVAVVAVGLLGLVECYRVAMRVHRGEEPFGPGTRPIGPHRQRMPIASFLVVAAWFAGQIVVMANFVNRPEPIAGPLGVTISGLLSVFLILVLLENVEPMSITELGLVPRSFGASFAMGTRGFLLAYPGVLAAIALSVNLRSRETQHGLITALQDNPSVRMLVLVFAGAVVLAPVVEELVFRVVAQGTLRVWVGSFPAVVFTSLVFAAVHGMPDSIALIPLALVLGWLYEETNDAIAAMVLHANFNLFNLLIAISIDPEEIERLRQAAEQAVYGSG